MGFYVSQLRSVPTDAFEYYVYIVDASEGATHSEEIAKSLIELAIKSGTNAGIVRGPSDLSAEVYKFLQTHASPGSITLENLFGNVSCLVVSEGSLQTTTKQVFVIPLAPRAADSLSQKPLIDELISRLIDSMHKHQLPDFCRSLGAQEIALKGLKAGALIATLRGLNEMLELKPNIAGLGLNLNALFQRILGSAKRET
jgi:hypothetical protein